MEKRISLYKKTDALIEKIWKVLVNVAYDQTTITFYRLLIKVGLSQHNRQTLLTLLTEIGEIENGHNRPLVNCLVVNNAGKPEPAFFIWLSCIPSKTRWNISQEELFNYHKNYAYTFWRDENNFRAFKENALAFLKTF